MPNRVFNIKGRASLLFVYLSTSVQKYENSEHELKYIKKERGVIVQTIKLKVVAKKYYNNTNGFGVYVANDVNNQIKPKEEDDLIFGENSSISITGNYLPKPSDTVYEMYIEKDEKSKYEDTYKVLHFHKEVVLNEAGIVSYLQGKDFKGCGPATAKKIYRKFGTDTLNVIEKNPERLAEVGIKEKTIEAIAKGYGATHDRRLFLVYGSSIGLTQGQIEKIFDKWGATAMNVLQTDPYTLITLPKFGFLTVDKIALGTGVELNSIKRIMAAIVHVLKENELNGHCAMLVEDLLPKAYETLGRRVDRERLEAGISEALAEGWIVEDADHYYLAATYKREVYVERRANELKNRGAVKKNIVLQDKVLDDTQFEAVKGALENPAFIITGGPGTGKTTIVKEILHQLRKERASTLCMAPTGKAARRMAEMTGEAYTIHSALCLSPDAAVEPIDADVVIIDEFSMVDLYLCDQIFKRIHSDTRIIILGDIYQLPSVGCGAVLRDLLTIWPHIKLTKTYRQEEGSEIINNAHKANNGSVALKQGNDFTYVGSETEQDALKRIVSLYKDVTKKYSDVAVLLPMRKGTCGIDNVNKVLQDEINPQVEGQYVAFFKTEFRVGDPVMHLTNKDLRSNGLVGRITKVGTNKDDVMGFYVEFQDIDVVYFYSNKDLDEITLCYAMTIHKSQGSEYPCIITAFLNAHYVMLKRNLLYTAITRAKNMVYMLGQQKAIKRAILNDEEVYRITRLGRRGIC